MGVTDRATADLDVLYERLLLARVVEDKMLKLLTQGRLSKWFSGIGQEAVAVGAASALRTEDWLLPLHRNLGVFTTRSRDLPRLFLQLLGRAGGHTQGRDRSFHFGALDDRIVGMISHLGAMLPVACGLALAARLRGEDRVALVFCGDGTASEGDVHEAMNLAAVWRLPVVFLIENNAWGLSTPASEQHALAAPVPVSSAAAELAAVYGPRRPLGPSGRGPVRDAARRRSPVTAPRERHYVDAIGDALRVAMRADDRVVLLGQDIAAYGGTF